MPVTPHQTTFPINSDAAYATAWRRTKFFALLTVGLLIGLGFLLKSGLREGASFWEFVGPQLGLMVLVMAVVMALITFKVMHNLQKMQYRVDFDGIYYEFAPTASDGFLHHRGGSDRYGHRFEQTVHFDEVEYVKVTRRSMKVAGRNRNSLNENGIVRVIGAIDGYDELVDYVLKAVPADRVQDSR